MLCSCFIFCIILGHIVILTMSTLCVKLDQIHMQLKNQTENPRNNAYIKISLCSDISVYISNRCSIYACQPELDFDHADFKQIN